MARWASGDQAADFIGAVAGSAMCLAMLLTDELLPPELPRRG